MTLPADFSDFSELISYNPANGKHEKLSKRARLSTIESFIYSNDASEDEDGPAVVYRIYGWLR